MKDLTHIDFLTRVAKAMRFEPCPRASIGCIHADYIKHKHVVGMTISSEHYHLSHEMIKDIEQTLEDIFLSFMWEACGLNSTWCVEAWHYGFNEPNITDGDIYVVDQEDGTFDVVRRYPSRDEDECKLIEGGFTSKESAMTYVENNYKGGK